ncbi:MAG: bifunctional helix-turn-helix domain-containing protein/methylated-DNA--[protein]-cysteine S-methyltransferase [Planctomycetota bacterium]|nr:bifunctional helix-turn-helix domain-containing protein/methylated-DNA--[protein]-cysteine S-methyltransferase [Planctomycetota bacterium]
MDRMTSTVTSTPGPGARTAERDDLPAVARALRYAAVHAVAQPAVADLARAAGLSETRFSRACREHAGITPKGYVQALTIAAARERLARSRPVLETSFRTGLSGGSRLHDLFVGIERMTPGEYARGGAGLAIAWDEVATPFGPALVCAAPRGVCALAFTEGRGLDAELAHTRARWPRAAFARDERAIAPAAGVLRDRLAGRALESGRSITLLLKGTDFELRVWEALLAIPEGSIASYGGLARALDVPRAARAVGRAIGANPVGVLIPCHRVLRETGALGGYRWGETTKRALLAAEASRA